MIATREIKETSLCNIVAKYSIVECPDTLYCAEPALRKVHEEIVKCEEENILNIKSYDCELPQEYPVIRVSDSITEIYEKFQRPILGKEVGDFGQSYCMHPVFIMKLIYNGMLTVASGVLEEPCIPDKDKKLDIFGIPQYTSSIHPTLYKFHVQFLLPKLHTFRSIVYTNTFICPRTERKKIKKNYFVTCDNVFSITVFNSVTLNGPIWVVPNIREAFIRGHYDPQQRTDQIRFHSLELWKQVSSDEEEPDYDSIPNTMNIPEHIYRQEIEYLQYMFREKRLVYASGDIGCTMGDIYLSLTGWRSHNIPGAGTVQLMVHGYLLKELGYSIWDLGSTMEYKQRIGADVVKRKDFISQFQDNREKKPKTILEKIKEPRDARTIVV